jgi:hypothetical protein
LVTLPFWFLGCTYAIKGVLAVWGHAFGPWLTHARVISIAAVSALLSWSLFAVAVLSDRKERPKEARGGPVVVGAIVALLYLITVGLYSTSVYPRIPVGLGGGKPLPLQLWMESDKPHNDLASLLSGATFTPLGDVLRVDGVYLLYSDDKELLLLNRQQPPAAALVVDRSRFQSISWGRNTVPELVPDSIVRR